VSCSALELQHVPAPPQVSNAETIVFVVEGKAAAYALVDGGLGAPVRISAREDVAIAAFYYRASLDDLQLAPGALGDSISGRDCRLLSPLRSYAFSGGEWTPSDAAPPLANAVDCAQLPCPAYQVTPFDLPSPEHVLIAVALDGERALIANIAGEFYQVDRTGPAERADLRGLPASAVHQDESGLWLAGGNRIVHRAPSGEIREMPARAAGEEIVALSGRSGRVLGLSIEEAETSTVHLFEIVPETRDLFSAHFAVDAHGGYLEWWDERAVAVFGGPAALLLDGDEVAVVFDDVQDLRFAEVQLNRANSVAQLDDSIVIGAADGYLYRPQSDRDWQPIEQPHLASAVDAIVPLHHDLFFAGRRGIAATHRPDASPCGPDTLFSNNIRTIVRLDERTLVTAGEMQESSGTNRVYWVEQH
jgi:hypothetical protein